MKLISNKKIADQAASKVYFDNPSSDFQLGLILGGSWAEDQIKPLFVLFGDWLGDNRHNWNRVTSIDSNINCYPKTTAELFGLWMKERNEK